MSARLVYGIRAYIYQYSMREKEVTGNVRTPN